MKIGDRVFVRGYIDEIRKDTVIIRNAGGYFGTIPSEVITGELPPAQPERKTGEWTINDCHAAVYKYHCSACGANHRARYDFCPSCGSYNGGEQE